MKTESYFAIDQTGGLQHVEQIVRSVELNDKFMEAMSKNVARSAKAVMTMAELTNNKSMPGAVNITLAPGNRVVNMPLFTIPLTTVWLMDDKGVLYPAFDSDGPSMPIVWTVPPDMMVILSAVMNDANQEVCQFLTAFDGNMRCWRLPLSNLYEDCKLCPGSNTDQTPNYSMFHGALKVWSQFQRSIWQKDLYGSQGDAGRKATRSLFRMTAVDKGFNQLEHLGSWQDHCKKIAVDFITQNIRP